MKKKYIVIYKLFLDTDLLILSKIDWHKPVIFESKKEALEIIKKSCIDKYIYEILEIKI